MNNLHRVFFGVMATIIPVQATAQTAPLTPPVPPASTVLHLDESQTSGLLLVFRGAAEDAIEGRVSRLPDVKKVTLGMKVTPGGEPRSLSFSDFVMTYRKTDGCRFDVDFKEGNRFQASYEFVGDRLLAKTKGLDKLSWKSKPDGDTDQAKKLFGCTFSDVGNFLATIAIQELLIDVDAELENAFRVTLPPLLSRITKKNVAFVRDIAFSPSKGDKKKWTSEVTVDFSP